MSYSAPPECPDAAALAREVGPHFRVIAKRGPCPTCVAHVDISKDETGAFVLQTGEEPTHNASCKELVDIAGFTVRSSHVHQEPATQPPAERPPILELGLYAGPRYSRTAQWAFGAQLGFRPLTSWVLRAHGDWTPKNSVPSQSGELGLSHSGHAAGLDVCRELAGWAAACALGEVQWFQVVPKGDGWTPETARQVALGLGATFRVKLHGPLGLQLQPALLAVPRPARVQEPDWLDSLYRSSPIQWVLRAAISWDIGGKTNF